jgi:putative hydrolase of HD superfamily
MDRDIEFLYEIGAMRFIPRLWLRFLNTGIANLSEHHVRVMWLALIIAQHEGIKNTEKVIKMALVHDIAESRTGDADYLSRQYVERDEQLGIKDMLKNTALEKEFIKLWQEYDKLESIEAKAVKDADNLEVDFEIQEQRSRGNILHKIWRDYRGYMQKNKYYTPTARKIARKLWASQPHDWHLKGRNRHNAGDWKAKS